jgi:Mor family transcriptional regulator
MEKIDTKNFGIIYVIHNYEYNIIKIGVTTNLPARLKSLISSSGFDLKVVYTTNPIKNYFEIESKVHIFFKTKRRLNTEWFNVKPKEAISYIKEIQKNLEIHSLCLEYLSGKTISELAKRYDVSRAYVSKILTQWNIYKKEISPIVKKTYKKEITLLKIPRKDKKINKNKDVENDFVPSKYRKNIRFYRISTNLYKHKEDDVYKTIVFNNGIIKERFFINKEDAILSLKL